MQNLLHDLTKLLSKDKRFLSDDGKLLKNKVIEASLQLDSKLLKLLLKSKPIKKHFFTEVDKTLVFDKVKFQKYISSKSFLEDSYTAFTNKIGLTVDDEFISEGKEVVLSWPYKDCVLEGGQTKEDEKREEIFWNETLAPDEIDRLLSPKVFTNFKKYNKKGEHKVTDISLEDNLIIKGNNLLALHSLLAVYHGIIKLICIDPPYNTGNDSFNYNDSFNHSSWLTFMRNRLMVAWSLLSDDGLIFISCNNEENSYLKILCDEIFGRELFVENIIWKNKYGAGAKTTSFICIHEYILCYSKKPLLDLQGPLSVDEIAKHNKKDEKFALRGPYRTQPLQTKSLGDRPNLVYPINYKGQEIWPNKQWVWSKERMLSAIKNNEVEFTEKDGKYNIRAKQYLNDANGNIRKGKPLSIIDNVYTQDGTKSIRELFEEDVFSFPKPPELIKKLLRLIINYKDDKDYFVLDFFSGSGTTAQAVIEVNEEDGGNRKFILCEQMDYIENVTIKRVSKVISNNKKSSFIYCELAKLNQKFVNQINSAKRTKELKQIWETIKKYGFISYKVNPKEIDNNISEFEQLSLQDQKKFLIAVLDKNHLYVNYSEIEDNDYRISDEDKKLNKKFYSLK